MNSNEATLHHSYGMFLASQGRAPEAIAHMERARELNPVSLWTIYVSGTVYVYARQYDDALKQFQKYQELNPESLVAANGLAMAYLCRGDYEKVIDILDGQETGGHPGLGLLGFAYARIGRREEALKLAEELRRWKAEPGDGTWGVEALIYIGLGDVDRAFTALEMSVKDHEWWASSLKVNPLFDDLRAHPRFGELLRRTGVEE